MKKLFLLIAIISFSFSMIFSQSITVTSPHSGDTWYKGNPYTISWTKTGMMDSRVKIRLFNSTGSTKIMDITNNTANDNRFGPWTLPESVPEGRYIIRVKTVDNAIHDDSDIFSVSGPGEPSSIVITNPMETGSYSQRGDLNVEWSSSNISGNVRVEMVEYEGSHNYIIRSSTPFNSSPVTHSIPETTAPGTYRIKISQGTLEAFSGRFGIFPYTPPGVLISSPRGGENKMIGTNLSIIWGTPHLSQDVKIELLRHGRKIGTIKSRIATRGGYYSWKAGTIEEPGKIALLARGGYSIRICTIDGTYCNESEGTFTLTNPKGIWLFKPGKNEILDIGSMVKIKWNATNVGGSTLTMDIMWGERHAYRIATRIPANRKSFDWRVGSFLNGDIGFRPGLTTGCKIRLTSDDGISSLSTYSKEFTIRNSGTAKRRKRK